MLNLIVSLDTYAWIYGCIGTILKSDDKFDVIILLKDNVEPIDGATGLCSEAIYEQRHQDAKWAGKESGIRKLINVGTDSYKNIVSERTIAYLTLYLTFNNIRTVYYQQDYYLYTMVKSIAKNLPLTLFTYNVSNYTKEVKIDIDRKKFMISKMIGLPTSYKNKSIGVVERFYDIKL